jgi:hypothetical protein
VAITEREWHDAATRDLIPADADVWLGLDVGWKWDTTAVVPLWWRDAEYRLLGPATVLVPPRTGDQLHPSVVKDAIEVMCSKWRVSRVVMDITAANDLTVVDRAQTSKPQSEDFERFMEGLRQGWLRHSGDEALRRHAFNAVVKMLPDGGAKFGRVSETRQGGNQEARVNDALVAAAMVHSYAVGVHLNPPPSYRMAGF